MLHELLLSLLGYTGDFVVDERERREARGIPSPATYEPTFKLASDLSFIEPSERSAIERLISLGFYYRELDRFATKSRNLSFIRSPKDIPLPTDSGPAEGRTGKASVYRRAIANGIVEVLAVYRAAVLQVEQNLLSDPMPILATVTRGLNKFDMLLPPLYELVVEIEREDIRGGQLVNILHKRCRCGVPELQPCIQRLLWHGHKVMYNQLASWMVYGILQDQHGEFFIRSSEILVQCMKTFGARMTYESPEFHKRLFESAISSIRTIAANHLWQLVVIRTDLNGHLKALKDYFLLAKGDFFQCFLEESRQLMRLPPRQSTAEADLMVPFQLLLAYHLAVLRGYDVDQPRNLAKSVTTQ